MKYILIVTFLFISYFTRAQNNFLCFVEDAVTKEKLQGVTAAIAGTKTATLSDSTGKIYLSLAGTGSIKITFSFVGYKSQSISFLIPQTNNAFPLIELQKDVEKTEEEVMVTSSRTNSRIEDLPTKVEVLGSEEMNEENGIKPANITSLLGDVAGIQIQQTSATTGNSDARIQGLPGKYTQVLRDGLPLFGGYSGSFSILQIPPLDLKQIEIVKGASSTLYGGGAIAGMINLVSKSPTLNSAERSVTINQSTLKETNANIYLSNRNKKTGYTLFAGGTYQRAVDVNKDGFSDVPDLKTVFCHPKLFFYPNSKQIIMVGFNLSYEDRNGGDMQVLHHSADTQHQFYIKNKSWRNTADAVWDIKLNTTDRLTVKGISNVFERDITTNIFGMKAKESAYFSEISYFKKSAHHNIVSGVNLNGENFIKKRPDSTALVNYNYSTIGFFLQDDWKINSQITVQTGLRTDYHNTYGSFILPRLTLLYKINTHLSTRLGGGYGYKTPSQFASEIDEREYIRFSPGIHIKAEKSRGVNWDINYKNVIDGWHVTINQMFYLTAIKNPLVQQNSSGGNLSFYSADKPINSKGFETYIAARADELEIYAGYTYTIAKQLYDPVHPNISLSARNKLATLISYELADKIRIGWETAYTGKQYLDDGNTTPGYIFTAGMLRYDIKKLSLVLNCENIFDYRQTRHETMYTGPANNPVFKQIWAPLDGRVINLSAKINW